MHSKSSHIARVGGNGARGKLISFAHVLIGEPGPTSPEHARAVTLTGPLSAINPTLRNAASYPWDDGAAGRPRRTARGHLPQQGAE